MGTLQYCFFVSGLTSLNNVLKVHPCRTSCPNFLPFLGLNNIPPCGWTSFVHPPWMLLSLGYCCSLGEQMSVHQLALSSVGVYLVVGLQDSTVTVLKTAMLFWTVFFFLSCLDHGASGAGQLGTSSFTDVPQSTVTAHRGDSGSAASPLLPSPLPWSWPSQVWVTAFGAPVPRGAGVWGSWHRDGALPGSGRSQCRPSSLEGAGRTERGPCSALSRLATRPGLSWGLAAPSEPGDSVPAGLHGHMPAPRTRC